LGLVRNRERLSAQAIGMFELRQGVRGNSEEGPAVPKVEVLTEDGRTRDRLERTLQKTKPPGTTREA